MFAHNVGLPPDWNLSAMRHFVWPPGAHHAKATFSALPAMAAAPTDTVLATSSEDAAGGLDDSVQPFGGVDAAEAARVIARAAAPAAPRTATEYVQAHQLQPTLDAALNCLVQSEYLPADPWPALKRCLPADFMVPPPPTVPGQGLDAAALGLDRIKQEFLYAARGFELTKQQTSTRSAALTRLAPRRSRFLHGMGNAP